MASNDSSLVCPKCKTSFPLRKLLDNHLRSLGHYVPSKRKLPDGYTPVTRTTSLAHRQDLHRRGGWSVFNFSVQNRTASPLRQDEELIEAEEGEITQREQELEALAKAERSEAARQKRQRKMQETKEMERMERQEKAKEWKLKEEERVRRKKEGRVKESWNNYAAGPYSEVNRRFLEIKRPVASSSDIYDFTDHSAKSDTCESRIRDHQAIQDNNTDRTHESSGFHERSIVSTNSESSRSLKNGSKISCQHSRNSAGIFEKNSSAEPDCSNSVMFHGRIATYTQGLDIQAERVEKIPANSLPVESFGGAVPFGTEVDKSLEFFGDRDDVGEWREEMHGSQYYYFG